MSERQGGDCQRDTIHIVCCICGDSRIMVGQRPTMGYEFAQAVHAAGFIAMTDYGRTLAFCSNYHADAALTKDGYFRRHMPRLPALPAMTATDIGWPE